MVTLAPPSAFDGDASTAARYLERYFEQRDGVPMYEGSRFERLAGGGDHTDVASTFTPADSWRSAC